MHSCTNHDSFTCVILSCYKSTVSVTNKSNLYTQINKRSIGQVCHISYFVDSFKMNQYHTFSSADSIYQFVFILYMRSFVNSIFSRVSRSSLCCAFIEVNFEIIKEGKNQHTFKIKGGRIRLPKFKFSAKFPVGLCDFKYTVIRMPLTVAFPRCCHRVLPN